jgi:hypothetical protein
MTSETIDARRALQVYGSMPFGYRWRAPEVLDRRSLYA